MRSMSRLALIMLSDGLAAMTGKDMRSTTQMSDRFSLGLTAIFRRSFSVRMPKTFPFCMATTHETWRSAMMFAASPTLVAAWMATASLLMMEATSGKLSRHISAWTRSVCVMIPTMVCPDRTGNHLICSRCAILLASSTESSGEMVVTVGSMWS